MDTKSLTGGVQVKDAAKGTVEAVFSTLDVKDLDGDVTLPGAFQDGAEVIISAYGHKSWQGVLPVGKGTISTRGSEAILDGQFFLDTMAGAETFATVKGLGALGQWSYGYDVVKSSYGEWQNEPVRFLEALKVHEVSPVLLGAGMNTRTLAAKAAGSLLFGEHGEAVLADLSDLIDRAVRAGKGKAPRAESAALLQRVESELKRLGELLAPDDAPVSGGTSTEDARREFLRFVQRAAL